MPDVWGLLPKSQDNAETIEEAIARIVGEHNDDSTAHTGAGQSLAVHRESEVIDHLAGSILADKQSAIQKQVTNAFIGASTMNQTGDVSIEGVGALRLYVEYPYTNHSQISADYSSGGIELNTDIDMYYQAVVFFDLGSTSYTSYFGFLNGSTSSSVGFGFNVRSNTLRAHVHDGTNGSEVTISGIDRTIPHTYRAFYIAGEGQFYFYIDGALVAQIAKGSVSLNQTASIVHDIAISSSNDGNMWCSFLNYSSGN